MIYCRDCMFLTYESNKAGKGVDHRCVHPNNVSEQKIDTWLMPERKIVCKHPMEINKDNDCKWFEKKKGLA